jgi:small conductance mechanosensitive channel
MDPNHIPEPLRPYFPLLKGIVIAILILVVGWVASKWTNRLVRRGLSHRTVDRALAGFIAAIAQYTVLAVAVITALGAVGLQTTTLVAVFASAGLAVGLALQGSLGNFASGVMILFFRPFTLGDKVTAGGHTGAVFDIGLFATTLVTGDNETIIVANSAVTGASITNFTRLGTLRGQIPVVVAYGTDPRQAVAIMEKAAARAELVLANPSVAVALTALGPRGLEFTVMPWANVGDYLGMLNNVRHALVEDLAAAGIEGAPPPIAIAPPPSP